MSGRRFLRVVRYSALAFCCLQSALHGEAAKDGIPEERPGLTIGETTVTLSPRMQLILPNGVVDVFLHQSLKRSVLDFESKYDFFDNSIYSSLDLSYLLRRLSLGVRLSDKVDFEEPLASQNTLQRTRFIMPYVTVPIADTTRFVVSTRFSNTYTAAVDERLVLDSGKEVVPSVGVVHDTLSRRDAFSRGDSISLLFSRSFGIFGGQYDYTQADFSLLDVSCPLKNHYIESRLKLGYPLSVVKRPLTEVYSLGGYEMFRGFDYKEFRGDSIAYIQFRYRRPIVVSREFRGSRLNIVSWEFSWELAKIGGREIFDSAEGVRASLGAGFGFDLTLFNAVNTKFDLYVGQPVDVRGPRLYFIISAVSYVKS